MLKTPVSHNHQLANRGIMDTGNNRQHVLKDPKFFPFGFRFIKLVVTGVHGPQTITVGIGIAYFITKCSDGSSFVWRGRTHSRVRMCGACANAVFVDASASHGDSRVVCMCVRW